MRIFLNEIMQALKQGQPVELVSILESSGSTPRRAGAMMAVLPGGRSIGTIGGGNVEFEAQKLAFILLDKHSDALRRFRFLPNDAASLGMVCGGDVTLLFHYFSAQNQQCLNVLQDLLNRIAKHENQITWFLQKVEYHRVIDFGLADNTGVYHITEKPEHLDTLLQERAVFDGIWFATPVIQANRTLIFGGGHVSQALVPLLSTLDFRPIVFDDRPEFSNPELFPQAEHVICGNFRRLGEQISITNNDYIVIITRGHQADYEVLTQVLHSDARYIGCIGSQKKLALCRERLLSHGFTTEEYERLHAPIGLPIGSETPEEIAVSIAAEMIAVRAKKSVIQKACPAAS